MKDFITTIASLMLLMIFLLQFVTNQSIYTKLVGAEYAVREFRITAEEKGELSATEIRRLKERTAELMGCAAEEVSVTLDEERKSSVGTAADDAENEAATFSYEVKMPLRGLIAAADFLGISAEENQAVYSSKGMIRIEPESEEAEEAEEAQEAGENEAVEEAGGEPSSEASHPDTEAASEPSGESSSASA